MTDSRHYSITMLLDAARQEDSKQPRDLFSDYFNTPHLDAAMELLTDNEREEYFAIHQTDFQLGVPDCIKDTIISQYPHLRSLWFYDAQFASNACRLAAVPELPASEYLSLAKVARGEQWDGNPANYDMAQ